jgi:MFS family permease
VRTILAGGLVLVALALFLMHGLSPSSGWTALLAGFIVGGIGIGIANPAIAGAALRTVDPGRTGMASGFNNTCRLAGVAIGVAALGAVLERSIATSLTPTLGPHDRAFAEAVSSAGVRAAAGRPELVHAADAAFVSGLNDLFVIGAVAVFAGAVAAAVFLRTPAPVPAPAAEPAQP